jgi:hypothetical protein
MYKIMDMKDRFPRLLHYARDAFRDVVIHVDMALIGMNGENRLNN